MSRRFLNLGSPVNWSSPINRGLAYWGLALPNNSGGSRLFDLCGRREGTLNNIASTDWVPAKRPGTLGKCLNFNGTTSYVDCGSLVLTDEMSASCWFLTTTVSAGLRDMVASCNAAGTAFAYLFEINNTAARLGYRHSGTSLISSTNLAANTWYHGAFVRSGSTGNWTVTFYVNGVADGSTSSITGNPQGGTQTLALGRLGASANFFHSGQIDSPRIYERALSADDIAREYADSLTGYKQALQWWGRSVGKAPATSTGQIFRSSIFNSAIIRGVA